MTQNFNRTTEKQKRRQLRKDQTFCEKIMWQYLKDRRLLDVKFRRQYSIDKFVLDFYCPELKLAVELDGSIHDDPEQKEYDKQRQLYIEKFGIRFVRIINDELMGNANMAFKKIEDEIVLLKGKIMLSLKNDLTPTPLLLKERGF